MKLSFALVILVWISYVAAKDEHSRPGWKKHSQSPSWCTISAERTLLSASSLCPIDHRECQKLCDDRPGCDAVEFWENHNYACFQCSSTSFVTQYTNKKDLAYPVYVWIREHWKAKGCYKEGHRTVLKQAYAVGAHKNKKDYKYFFEFCKEKAEPEQLKCFGIKFQRDIFTCLTTKNGEMPHSGKYGKVAKHACKIDQNGFGVGVKTGATFVYTTE